jgi:pimeloyl-ACP methyl ester carboxylesterase
LITSLENCRVPIPRGRPFYTLLEGLGRLSTGMIVICNFFWRKSIIYFDMRGVGLSAIPLPNTYDQFLRAKFVVEDIEMIRQKVLDNKPWDAIYAHSYGTIVAQQYASKYSANVEKLILSAPVSRNLEYDDARIAMIVSNLVAIYENYSRAPCECESMGAIGRIRRAAAGAIFGVKEMTGTDNFCFVSEVRPPGSLPEGPLIDKIKNTLQTLFDNLKKDYKHISFVFGNYRDLVERDKEFQKQYRYRRNFLRPCRACNSRVWQRKIRCYRMTLERKGRSTLPSFWGIT